METKQCRKCNEIKNISMFSKHSGTADKLDNRCKDCVKKAKKESKESKNILEYQIYDFDHDSKEWQVGKPTGSILTITSTSGTSRYEVRIPLGNGKLKSKSFSFNKFDTPEDARKSSEKWLKDNSKLLDLTRNQIRKIDEKIYISFKEIRK